MTKNNCVICEQELSDKEVERYERRDKRAKEKGIEEETPRYCPNCEKAIEHHEIEVGIFSKVGKKEEEAEFNKVVKKYSDELDKMKRLIDSFNINDELAIFNHKLTYLWESLNTFQEGLLEDFIETDDSLENTISRIELKKRVPEIYNEIEALLKKITD